MKRFLFFAWLCPVTAIIVHFWLCPPLAKYVAAANCLGVAFPVFTFKWFENDSLARRSTILLLGAAYFVTGIYILIFTMAAIRTANMGLGVPDSDLNVMRSAMPFVMIFNLSIGGIMYFLIKDWKRLA